MSTGRKGETFQPVTMGHIRGHGVTRLIVYCKSLWCNHSATLNADWLTDDTILLALEASKKAPTIAELRKQRGDLPRSRPVTTGWTQSTSHTSRQILRSPNVGFRGTAEAPRAGQILGG